MILAARRLSLRFALLLALVLFPTEVRADGGERLIYNDGFVRVLSEDPLGKEECKTISGKIRAAWEFDLGVMRWSDHRKIDGPIELRVMSPERFEHRGSANCKGVRFTMRTNLLDDESGYRTIAHELGHLQSYRALGKRACAHEVPKYFLEGHGNELNRLYAEHLHIIDAKGNAQVAHKIMSLGAEEVRKILTDDAYSKTGDFTMECVGFYLVEYLQAPHHGKAIAEVVPRMARVFEAVGKGDAYDVAFRKAFGVSIDAVVGDVVALFERTAAHPEERLTGTRLAAFVSKAQ